MAGICALTTKLDAERLNRLSQLLPAKADIGVLLNSDRPDYKPQRSILENQAPLGITLHFEDIVPSDATTSVKQQIDAKFKDISDNKWLGALVGADPVFNNHRPAVVTAAKNQAIPTMYQWREFAEEGGLISYGPNLVVAYTLAGTYVGQILDGTTPKQVGVLSLNNFELVINLKTADDLSNAGANLDISPALLASADELIVK
jgi:putative ABC transport system substrate-binding protein